MVYPDNGILFFLNMVKFQSSIAFKMTKLRLQWDLTKKQNIEY